MCKIIQYLFGKERPFRQLLFNIISVIGFAGGLISFIVSLITKLPVLQDVIVFTALLVLILCIYLANAKGKLQLASTVIIVMITMLLMPAMFFTGGGVYSGMPSWFIMGMVFTFLLIEGKLCYILLALQGVIYTLCFLAAYYHREWVQPFPSESGVYLDAVQSMFVAAMVIGLIIRFQTNTYERMLRQSIEQNRQLEEAKDTAMRANSAKTQFLSHMSHDIRTPINGIIGMLDIAEDSPDDLKKQAECREKIRISSNHLLSLINDVLDISMVESGKVELSDEVFDIRTLVKDCIAIMGDTARERGISLEVQLGKIGHPYLYGSPLHLRQIIINIVGNALKYNQEGGRVAVSLEETGSTEERAEMRLCVRDTGIGMSKEFLAHIFEPFTQADNGARTKYSGSGLGMSITKGFVERMGGTITVDSAAGVGSTFTVLLPFRISEEPARVEESKPESDSIDGMEILLVEDNDLNLEIAQYMLEHAGAHVTCARNGEEAIRLFAASEEGKFDCILMDIMMPVMDGLEAARRIRALGRTDAGKVAIVAMTANAYVEDVKKTRDAGMDEHLAKPIEKATMYHTLSVLYRRRHPEQH
ncbi:MAG: ATP-binding protein [Lachnospiraceae bacterium]|jgi:signal transduction histidine kinase/AmiR/NasT family two-component response regulator|nr:ATP-binding protein [Lachnospiraceae bacterium]